MLSEMSASRKISAVMKFFFGSAMGGLEPRVPAAASAAAWSSRDWRQKPRKAMQKPASWMLSAGESLRVNRRV